MTDLSRAEEWQAMAAEMDALGEPDLARDCRAMSLQEQQGEELTAFVMAMHAAARKTPQ